MAGAIPQAFYKGVGRSGRIFQIIRSMYESVKSCVRTNKNVTSFFLCESGVRQGEILSPLLFTIFINDLEESLFDANVDSGVTLLYLRVFVLLFADDTVIVNETKEGLIESLKHMYAYCKEWGIQVNIIKTKVVVFESRKTRYDKWFWEDEEIVQCSGYKYLGVWLSSTGNFGANTAKTSRKR